MRTLKSILTRAGELKMLYDDPEDILALKVLQDVNISKFTKEDIPLYLSIILDLFPGHSMPSRTDELLTKHL